MTALLVAQDVPEGGHLIGQPEEHAAEADEPLPVPRRLARRRDAIGEIRQRQADGAALRRAASVLAVTGGARVGVDLGAAESLRGAAASAGDDERAGTRQESAQACRAREEPPHAGAEESQACKTRVSSGMTAHVMRATLSSVVITR